MSDDVAERLRKRAYRLAAKDFNGDGAKLAMEAADEITRLRAENEKLREENDGWQMDGASCANEVKYLRAELAAVTAERDRMREALKPLIEIEDYPDTILMKRIRDLRAALEGVTEPPR